MRSFCEKPDVVVARIAARQHGVVGLEQLRWAGLSRHAIKRRVAAGRLHRVHRGVYAVGHTDLGHEGRWLAAVLALGDQAVLSHDSAAALWQLSPPTSAVVHVTVPMSGGRRRRPGIRLHYSRSLTARDTTRRHNIPVTTRERTLADLGYGPEPTRSHLEREFLKLVRGAGLPAPEVNVRVGAFEVDFLWRDERVVAETDGWAYHSGRSAFEADRRRDRELHRRGFTVLRFTYPEVTEGPDAIVTSLRAHLRTRQGAAAHGHPTDRSTHPD